MQRDTSQRRAIRQVFQESGRPMGPQEVLNGAKSIIPKIGIATVYRTLNSLVEEGWLVTVDLPGKSTVYEISGKTHHHHFHCRECGRVYEVEGCPTDLMKMLPNGYKLEGHEIVLYGVCKKCMG